MASLRPAKIAPVTSQDLLRERQEEWRRFTVFTAYGTVGVAALLVLMKIFLV